jgi:hypothetical protein
MRLERGERITPGIFAVPGHTGVTRWMRGHPGTWSARFLGQGLLPDGRHYVSSTWAGDWAFPDFAHADRAVGELMAEPAVRPEDGDWYEIPAAFTGTGKPADPSWQMVGGRWRRIGSVTEGGH